MFRGLLTKNQYLFYLNQQLQIFQTIESIGLPHSSLKRTENVQADIDELRSSGYYFDLILSSTKAYTAYLGSLSYEEVLPHVYLNYMGLIFGGQIIKKSVPSTGKMYTFDNMQEAIQSIRAVQNDVWAEEVNKGFDFNILIFEELEVQCLAEN